MVSHVFSLSCLRLRLHLRLHLRLRLRNRLLVYLPHSTVYKTKYKTALSTYFFAPMNPVYEPNKKIKLTKKMNQHKFSKIAIGKVI